MPGTHTGRNPTRQGCEATERLIPGQRVPDSRQSSKQACFGYEWPADRAARLVAGVRSCALATSRWEPDEGGRGGKSKADAVHP